VAQNPLSLPEHPSTLGFSGDRVARYLVFCVVLSRLLFVFLSVFFWQLHCRSFLDLQLLITPFGIFKHFLISKECGSCNN